MKNDKPSILGQSLRKHRLEKQVTQWELAQAIGLQSAQYISNIERGRCGMNIKRIHRAAKVLGIDVQILVDAATQDHVNNFLTIKDQD